MAIKAKTLITLTQERQVTEIRNFYKATNTNTKPSAVASSIISNWTSAGWETSEPAYNKNTPYVWICMQTVFGTYNATTNPNNYINSDVSLSSSYTAAINANILAEGVAANTASFWTRYTDGHDKNDSTIPILAGAYASSNPNVDYLDTSTFEYNSYFGANALAFRYKTLNLAKYATNGVQIYKVATGTTYKLSTDTVVNSSKIYYTYSNNVFTKVASPSGNPSAKGYYEAVAILSQSNPVIELTYDIIDVNGTPGLKNRLTFYDPETDNKTMELTSSALSFYNPLDGSTELAKLNTNGLILKKGGITAGNYSTSPNKFIYLSTEDYSGSPTITINGNSSGWRQIIGTKFGVKNDGTLYASNAVISGQITVGSGSDLSAGLDDYSTTSQMNSAIGTATNDMATKTYVGNQGYQTASNVNTIIGQTNVSALNDGSDYTKTENLGDTTAVQNAAKTASNYLGDTDSNAGVTLKAQNGTTTANTSTSNYIKINASGLEIFKGGVSVALYGDTARIGKSNNSRFLLNADSLQAYNSSNTKYFEVSANGMTYGSNTVASTSYADGKADTAESNAKTAAQSYADTAEANASYSVEIKVDSINYVTNSAKLIAVPYQKGTVTTGTFNWYKNNTNTAHGGTVSTTTNTNDTLTITDLNASYIAVLQ